VTNEGAAPGRGRSHQPAEVDTKAMAVLQALACLKRVTSRGRGNVTCFACDTRPNVPWIPEHCSSAHWGKIRGITLGLNPLRTKLI